MTETHPHLPFRLFLNVLASSAVIATGASGQRLSELSTAAQVRLRTDEAPHYWHTGVLERVTPDTLAVQLTDARLTVARTQIAEVQVRGTDAPGSTRYWQGALLGALSGLLVDGALMLDATRGEHSEDGGGIVALAMAAPLALLGATVGAIYNGSRSRERWSTVETSR